MGREEDDLEELMAWWRSEETSAQVLRFVVGSVLGVMGTISFMVTLGDVGYGEILTDRGYIVLGAGTLGGGLVAVYFQRLWSALGDTLWRL